MTTYSLGLDVELFISEVKKYPELWDINCEEYRHKNKKSRAWGQVAKVFVDDYDELSLREKNDVYKKLFNKWRNIRDSYVRHVKRKYGKKGYLYAKHLTFLSDLYKQTNLSGSDGEDQNDESWASDEENKFKKILFKSGCFETKEEPLIWQNDDESTDSSRKRRKTEIELVETSFPEATSSVGVPVDEDKSFFDSLLPAVKDFTIDQKLELRSDIIKLIKNYRLNARSSRNRYESD